MEKNKARMRVLFEIFDLIKKPKRIDLVIPEGCAFQPAPGFFLGDRNINLQYGTENPTYVNMKVTILANTGVPDGKRNK